MDRFVLSRLALLAGAVLAPSGVFAQAAGAGPSLSQASLSPADRAAISSILDALATQKGETLDQSVVRALDGPGVDAQAVARAVKLAAGSNLPGFQSVLVRKCLGGGAAYCTLASLQPPSTPGSDVQTAATNSGGAGGGGGLGGTPQVNLGHTAPFSSGGSLFDAAGHDGNFQNFGRSFLGASTPAITGSTAVAAATIPTVSADLALRASPTVAAPGPLAGAGAPVALAIAGWSFWRRRRRGVR